MSKPRTARRSFRSVEVQPLMLRGSPSLLAPTAVVRTTDVGMTKDSPLVSVLIVHSDPVVAAGLRVLLRRRREFRVQVVGAREFRGRDTRGFGAMAEVVVADYESGVHLSASVRDLSGRVVILTHSDSEAKIRYALTQGVRGYLLSGCGSEELIAAVRSVHEGGVAVAPQVARRIAESLRHEALTTKEASVLRQMMLGRSNKRIASE